MKAYPARGATQRRADGFIQAGLSLTRMQRSHSFALTAPFRGGCTMQAQLPFLKTGTCPVRAEAGA